MNEGLIHSRRKPTILHGNSKENDDGRPLHRRIGRMTPRDDPLAAAALWVGDGHGAAIGTVIETWGSAPRPAGSQIAVRDDGAFVGSVSGGCVEADVITRAMDVITQNTHQILEYGVADEKAWEVGLACGGTIRLYLEPITP